jgi:SAM-dependent methyltransferase
MTEQEKFALTEDPVAQQYERWAYPTPCQDLSTLSFDSPNVRFQNFRKLSPLFWPERPYREDVDILVAGCGTVAAAGYAYLHPKARVVGIDISAASLAHEELLKQKHGLERLTLQQCRVEDVASLGATFDFITSHGVLHHLADPVAGLRALGGVLRRDGVIDLMVYAPYGRTGVYMFQELFRLMGLGQTPRDVQTVKDALACLGPQHPLRRYLAVALDLNADEGLVDTFLHARDRAFSVGQCLDLVEQAGLVFQGWQDSGLYHAEGRLSPTSPLWPQFDRLDDRRLWQAIELYDGTIPGHWFLACGPDRDPAGYRVQFDDEAFLGYVPVLRISQSTPADPLRRASATIARPPFPPLPLDDWQVAVLSRVGGSRPVADCLRAAAGPAGPIDVSRARRLFRLLWRVGYVMFRIGAVK